MFLLQVPQVDTRVDEDAEVLIEATQDDVCPKAAETESQKQEEMIPESTDVSIEDVSKNEDRKEETKQGTSPNMSGSSDLVSGTPQKTNSRRQSFITLEKYAEGKPSSPASASKFTGPLVKTSNSQEHSDAKTSSKASDSQEYSAGKVGALESPVRPRVSGTKCEPVRLTDRLPSDSTVDEDVIPDTQTDAEAKETTEVDPTSRHNEPLNQEGDLDSQTLEDSQTLDDSQSSESSQGEPRRSGRHRVRPLLPGEDPEERDQKFVQLKRRRSEGESKGDSPKLNLAQSKRSTRSQNAAEEESRLRTRAQREKGESSQTNSQGRVNKKMRLYSSSQDFLDQPEPRRRSTRDRESSQTDLRSDSQTDSQSQGRFSRRRKSLVETKEDAGVEKKTVECSQMDSQSEQGSQSQGKISRRSRSVLETKEVAVIINKELPNKETVTPEPEWPKNDKDEPTQDSAAFTSTLKASKSQEFDLKEQTERYEDSQNTPPQDSQDLTELTNDSVKDVVDKTKVNINYTLSQEDAQAPSCHSQMLRKSRRNKSLSVSAQSQVSESVETKKKEEDSQSTPSKPEVKDKTKEGAYVKLSQENSQEITPSSSDSQSLRKSRRGKSSPDSQTYNQSQESQTVKQTREDLQMVFSSAAPESQEETSSSQELRSKLDVGDETKGVSDDQLSQEDSQVNTPSLSESQSLRKSRRSKAAEEKSKDKESSRKQSKSTSQVTQNAVEQAQAKPGARTRRSMGKEDQLKSLSEDSQSVNGPAESSQGWGRTSRRSSQALVAESSGSESSEVKESTPVPKKRGRKLQASLPSPVTLESKDVDAEYSQDSQGEESQCVETQTLAQEEQPTEVSEEPQHRESPMEVEEEVEKTETEKTKTSETLTRSPQKDQQKKSEINAEPIELLKPAEVHELAEITAEQTHEEMPCDSASIDKLSHPDEATEHLQMSESPEEQASEPDDEGEKDQIDDSNKQECPVDAEEELTGQSQDVSPDRREHPDAVDDNPEEEQPSADTITLLQERNIDTKPQVTDCQDVEGAQINSENDANMAPAPGDTCFMSALSEMTRSLENTEKLQGSPVKQKDLEAVMGQDVGQSPSGGRTKGSWSPSASPSTSILKKGQKRPLEDETPSPLVKVSDTGSTLLFYDLLCLRCRLT